MHAEFARKGHVRNSFRVALMRSLMFALGSCSASNSESPAARMFSATVCDLLHVDDLASEYDYLQHIIEKQQDRTLFYCVFSKVVGQLIGGLAIRDSRVFASQLYCWLNEQFWGRGYLQEAMPLAMNAYFSFFNESYVRAHVDIDNMRSYYALKKCGFVDFGMSKGPRGKQYILIFRQK